MTRCKKCNGWLPGNMTDTIASMGLTGPEAGWCNCPPPPPPPPKP